MVRWSQERSSCQTKPWIKHVSEVEGGSDGQEGISKIQASSSSLARAKYGRATMARLGKWGPRCMTQSCVGILKRWWLTPWGLEEASNKPGLGNSGGRGREGRVFLVKGTVYPKSQEMFRKW